MVYVGSIGQHRINSGLAHYRFIDKYNPGYLFKPNYWKVVSADGIASHLGSLCHAIEDNWDVLVYETFSLGKDVPTPDAKEKYAAEKRCCLFEEQYKKHNTDFYDMAVQYAYNEFLEAIKPMQKEIAAKGMENEHLEQLLKYQRNAMATFNVAVEYHRDDMYEANRDKLSSMCSNRITLLAYNQTPWNSTSFSIQLFVDRALQMRENAIQERTQQEVEQRMKNIDSATAQIMAKFDEQRTEICHLKAIVAKNDAEISNHIDMNSMLKAVNNYQDKDISRLETANSEKDDIISALKVANSMLESANNEKDEAINMLKAANSEKDVVIHALETEAEAQDELIAACRKDVSKLRTVIDRQDTVIDELASVICGQETVINEQQEMAGAQENKMKAHQLVADQLKTTIEEQRTLIRQHEESIKGQTGQIDALLAQVAKKEADIARASKEVAELGAALACLVNAQHEKEVS
ncbi:hypothetical protein THASP1DRAFT_28568 [Thamnocephalis sphaerospora]|uniref:Uncharacterized protein n=1 Tax=Thamnocephalis sphaerospora TaxID=78915 RepID=A0A4P9XTV0_9FUNG|nr:hypothetical protein THASP1DRAFT_28568 [Thamnocephalis sphaerospora]|eukprot:RKP09625.1 hypothetical protein THASP1DRAFT_28568 [Thamnocephalis sphaerospora]